MANSGINEAANKSLKLTVAARVCLTCGLRQLVYRLANSWKQCSNTIILRRVDEPRPQLSSSPLGCLTMDVGKREVRHRCAEGFPGILLAQCSGVVDSRSGNFEIGLSVQRFYSATVAEKVARLNVQTIKAKTSQPNKSLNLTSPALRGERRNGAVKRAPQVSSSPLGSR